VQLSFLILATMRWDKSDRLALMVRDRMPRREVDDDDLDGMREE
jgi:hypothetical protein